MTGDRASADTGAVLPMGWDLSPALHVNGEVLQQYHCELGHGHGGAHQSSEGDPDFPMRWMQHGPTDAEQAVERVLALADSWDTDEDARQTAAREIRAAVLREGADDDD
jgi:hypothetical protein